MKSRKIAKADNALWNNYVHGDKSALAEIVKKYHPHLAYVLFRYARNETEVKDLVSEVFAWIVENQHRLVSMQVRNVGAFLIEVGKKMYFSKQKKLNRRRELLEEKVFPFLDTTDLPYGLHEAYVEDIYATIKSMTNPVRRKIIFMLIEGFDACEIADAFGKTPKWAHQNIYLARKELKELMG